jgi:hypothetical protein
MVEWEPWPDILPSSLLLLLTFRVSKKLGRLKMTDASKMGMVYLSNLAIEFLRRSSDDRYFEGVTTAWQRSTASPTVM